MKTLNLHESHYYLKSSLLFFKNNFRKRLKFLSKKKFLFSEISNFLNNCIDNSKDVLIFCAGNSIISKNINSEKIYIKEIDKQYNIQHKNNIVYKNNFDDNEISNFDSIIIADIEHQLNPALNLLQLSKKINDDAKIIIIEMGFQLGKSGVSKFRNMWKALQQEPPQYDVASIEMLDSRWAKQTPNRAQEMAEQMKTCG